MRRALREAGGRLAVFGLRGAVALLARLPLAAVVRLGRLGADVAYAVGPWRRTIRANLDLVYGERLPRAEKRRIAREANRNAVLTLLEMLRATDPRAGDEMAACQAFEPAGLIESLAADSRGALIAMAHSGNFDGLGVAWSRRCAKPAWGVMKSLKARRVGRFLEDGRRRLGFGVIDASGVSAMLRAVRRVSAGEVVCILPDQYARSHGAVVEFLGVTASTHRGAASVALQSRDARIVVAVDTRVDGGARHVCHLVEIDDFARSDDFEADVERLTQRFCDAMGAVILRHPESYLWHHRRFGHPGSAVRRLGKGGVART